MFSQIKKMVNCVPGLSVNGISTIEGIFSLTTSDSKKKTFIF